MIRRRQRAGGASVKERIGDQDERAGQGRDAGTKFEQIGKSSLATCSHVSSWSASSNFDQEGWPVELKLQFDKNDQIQFQTKEMQDLNINLNLSTENLYSDSNQGNLKLSSNNNQNGKPFVFYYSIFSIPR